MIAKRVPTIMPELTYEEMLEITGDLQCARGFWGGRDR